MATRRTNRGATIDMDALMASSSSPAVGNMGVNANGDLIKGGKVVKKNEDRVREYYRANPKSSTANASLKGDTPSKLQPDMDPAPAVQPKTAKTAKTTKAAKASKSKPDPAPVVEPDEFDAPAGVEPLGYKEVELPNGDIQMVPYYNDSDK